MMGSGTVVVYVTTTFILKEISPRSKKLFVQTAGLNQYFGHLEKMGIYKLFSWVKRVGKKIDRDIFSFSNKLYI